MADLKITLTAAQVTRVKAAFASTDTNGDKTDATVEQIQDAIKAFIHSKVSREEQRTEQIAANAKAATTLTDEGW